MRRATRLLLRYRGRVHQRLIFDDVRDEPTSDRRHRLPTQIAISKVQRVGKDYLQNNPQNVTTLGAYNRNGCPLYATLRSFRSEFNLRRRFEFAEHIYCLSNHHKRRKRALFRSDG